MTFSNLDSVLWNTFSFILFLRKFTPFLGASCYSVWVFWFSVSDYLGSSEILNSDDSLVTKVLRNGFLAVFVLCNVYWKACLVSFAVERPYKVILLKTDADVGLIDLILSLKEPCVRLPSLQFLLVFSRSSLCSKSVMIIL